jgi:hypothetical protein
LQLSGDQWIQGNLGVTGLARRYQFEPLLFFSLNANNCQKAKGELNNANTIAPISSEKFIVFMFFFSFETRVNSAVCP